MQLHPRLAIREDAGPLTRERTKPITESTRLIEVGTPSADQPNRRTIQIITPGWGSSGYYSSDVLERAATNKVFPAGTHMYLNHMSESERHDRPERDVEKIAAVLVEDASWDGTRLTAPADLMGPHAELIESLAPYIGVSISGSATDITVGEAEGRTGPIISDLAYVESVDFVTRAGRGGMVLLESARPSLVNAAALRHSGVTEATVNDTREALTQVLRDTYGGDKTYVWVRDFDDTTVWFEVEDSDGAGIYGQGYTQAESGAVALVGEWTEVRVVTSYVAVDATTTEDVPATRPDSNTTTQESKEDTMPQIEEARLRQLEADAGRVPTLTESVATAQRERDEARRELAESNARTVARTRAHTRVTTGNAQLPAAAVERIVEASVASVPLTEAGELDEAAFDIRVDGARTAEESYLASLAEGAGAGTVRGFGATPDQSTEVEESTPTTTPWGRPLAVKGA